MYSDFEQCFAYLLVAFIGFLAFKPEISHSNSKILYITHKIQPVDWKTETCILFLQQTNNLNIQWELLLESDWNRFEKSETMIYTVQYWSQIWIGNVSRYNNCQLFKTKMSRPPCAMLTHQTMWYFPIQVIKLYIWA